ncbi:hypothetical protein FISHEDRAFT_61471 [Fistulina hepatica ATCC 64428]|uniref:F-box domain-containing protein n=1 Tax=Fistulina hepatica ATCC 64428 TaxID=1128425 RepID=A0A0D7A3L1_9AGAR|nr:hypothetical protein FISHEDRAFT_61471 [Fistulina hepatica ATCC 64428]
MALLPTIPPVLRLPLELLHEILSDIEFHAHLLALALTCHAFKNLVIPRHIQYRVITTRNWVSPIWSHLARRRDLARNIRQVHMFDKSDTTFAVHIPTILLDSDLDRCKEVAHPSRLFANVAKALANMERLEVFTWSSWDELTPTVCPTQENAIFHSLCAIRSLKHIALMGNFGLHAKELKYDPKSEAFPLWNVRNLESLCLRGPTWINPHMSTHVRTFINRSPALEYLEVPMEFSRLHECHLPLLKRAKVKLESGGTSLLDHGRISFLDRHPQIEELYWFPLGYHPKVKPDMLPNLRRLQTNIQVIGALDHGSAPRSMEDLYIYDLDVDLFMVLRNVDRMAVKRLRVSKFGSMKSIARLAEVLPSLTEWIDALSQFRKLEIFRGAGLWSSVNDDIEKMHLVVLELIDRCPNLRELDHLFWYGKGNDWQRIAIRRDLPHKYEICAPTPKRWFDVMDGIFD